MPSGDDGAQIALLRARKLRGHAHEARVALVRAVFAIVVAHARRTELIEIGLVEAEPDLYCVKALALTTRNGSHSRGRQAAGGRLTPRRFRSRLWPCLDDSAGPEGLDVWRRCDTRVAESRLRRTLVMRVLGLEHPASQPARASR